MVIIFVEYHHSLLLTYHSQQGQVHDNYSTQNNTGGTITFSYPRACERRNSGNLGIKPRRYLYSWSEEVAGVTNTVIVNTGVIVTCCLLILIAQESSSVPTETKLDVF